MGFWDLMVKKDDIIVSFVEGVRNIKNCMDGSVRAIRRKMNDRPLEGPGKELYILLNAPSLKTQDISVLKGKNTMFVNRGFMHPLYKELQPKYHVFIDIQMLKGVWPISSIHDIGHTPLSIFMSINT